MTFLSSPVGLGIIFLLTALVAFLAVTYWRARRIARAQAKRMQELFARASQDVRIRPSAAVRGKHSQLASTGVPMPREGQRAPIPKGRAFRAARQSDQE